MMVDQRHLERENRYVVTAIQAALGLIAPSVDALALEVRSDQLHFRFWVHGGVDEVEADAEEMIFDMDALLQPEDILITYEVLLGTLPSSPSVEAGRWLYLSKPATSRS